jgi:hypothetical protein
MKKKEMQAYPFYPNKAYCTDLTGGKSKEIHQKFS